MKPVASLSVLLLCVAQAASLGACGAAERVGPPPAAPSVMTPVQAIPADLDVVVRIDLEPIRAALPAQAQSDLAAVALAGDFSAATDVVRRALNRARQVWVGFRPGQPPEQTDNVLVLRGDFSKIPLAELGDAFKPARDLGGGWSAYDARRVRGRSAPARLYTHLDDLWVVASEAELDAVERVLEEGVRERRLEPPERGVLSVAARMAGVAASIRQSSPKAARFLSQADVGTMSADLSSEGLEVFAELGFVDEATAARSARALQLVLGAVVASNPDGFQAHTEINTVGSAVTLRAKVPHSLLSSFLPHEAAPEIHELVPKRPRQSAPSQRAALLLASHRFCGPGDQPDLGDGRRRLHLLPLCPLRAGGRASRAAGRRCGAARGSREGGALRAVPRTSDEDARRTPEHGA